MQKTSNDVRYVVHYLKSKICVARIIVVSCSTSKHRVWTRPNYRQRGHSAVFTLLLLLSSHTRRDVYFLSVFVTINPITFIATNSKSPPSTPRPRALSLSLLSRSTPLSLGGVLFRVHIPCLPSLMDGSSQRIATQLCQQACKNVVGSPPLNVGGNHSVVHLLCLHGRTRFFRGRVTGVPQQKCLANAISSTAKKCLFFFRSRTYAFTAALRAPRQQRSRLSSSNVLIMIGAGQLRSLALALALCLYHVSAFAGVVSARPGGAISSGATAAVRANAALPPRAIDAADQQLGEEAATLCRCLNAAVFRRCAFFYLVPSAVGTHLRVSQEY